VCKILNPTNVARFLKRKNPLEVTWKLPIDSSTAVDDESPVSDVLADKNDNEITHAQMFQALVDKA